MTKWDWKVTPHFPFFVGGTDAFGMAAAGSTGDPFGHDPFSPSAAPGGNRFGDPFAPTKGTLNVFAF